jgi:hypothetical protein
LPHEDVWTFLNVALRTFRNLLRLFRYALLQSCEPALTLLCLRDGAVVIGVTFARRCVSDGRGVARFNTRSRFDWRSGFGARFDRRSALRFVCEHFEHFRGASSVCPIDGVESEVIAQLRIRARFEQKRNEMRVSEDGGED